MALVIGHKGAAALAEENRATAVRTARAVGADGVEFDVRRAPDDRPAVWHDPTLPDGQVLLETPWDRLAADIDDLTTVLDAAAGLRLVNIEIKNWPLDTDYDPDHTLTRTVVDLVTNRTPAERHSFVISCFDLPTLDTTRAQLEEQAPEVATGRLVWLVDDPAGLVAETAERGHRALHPHHSAVTAELITAAHGAGLTVNCWTCNDPDRIRWLADIGTDGIITDDPKLARAALDSP